MVNLSAAAVHERTARDPRGVLAREKYFSLRPKPLEQWLWRQHVAPAAERVFWLHWQEGMRNGDWCSEIPLRRVAQQCCLDVSTVTRAYQLLAGLGLIRRADPGRDPANPFQQATAITEVLIPRELLLELDRHGNRACMTAKSEPAAPAPTRLAAVSAPAAERASDPFPGLSLKQRLAAMAALTGLMSAGERQQFDHALRLHQASIVFDEVSRLGPEQRSSVLQWLDVCALRPAAGTGVAPAAAIALAPSGPRQLSVLELARLRRQLQGLVAPPLLAERLREVVWSIEHGALRRFQCLHAMRIALKKIRDGQWSRPHRMPPQWVRPLSLAAEGRVHGA
jgi:hypothetical protein